MMTAPEAFLEIETRKINLVYTFDALWLASVDVKGETLATRKRNVKSISAIALTSIGAVELLVAKLDANEEALRNAA